MAVIKLEEAISFNSSRLSRGYYGKEAIVSED